MRTKKSLDKIFWFIVMVLPIGAWFVLSWRNSSATDILPYINAWGFAWVENIIDGLFAFFDGYVFPLNGYLSYLVAVEIAHCAFDIIVFIPRFAHWFIDMVFQKGGIE